MEHSDGQTLLTSAQNNSKEVAIYALSDNDNENWLRLY